MEHRQLLRRIIRKATTTLVVVFVSAHGLAAELRIDPPRVLLGTPESSEQLLVSRVLDDLRATDLTRRVSFKSADTSVAIVSSVGRVEPVDDGSTEIIISLGDAMARIDVEVRGIRSPSPVSFQRQVIPILSKAGCNTGGGHGKAEGQNGFKLSVFGFDP